MINVMVITLYPQDTKSNIFRRNYYDNDNYHTDGGNRKLQ